jgi:exodeoxyribonuclease VII large subunit
MFHVLERRFANFSVIIYPVKVQGQQAKQEIVEAIDYFNSAKNVEVIVIARGGGSIEDLQPFNEESVAKAIYKSQIPIISAVGHETDFTIADFVSDVRAPTPSRAAELVIPQKEELIQKIVNFRQQINKSLKHFIPQLQQRLDDLIESLQDNLKSILKDKQERLESNMQRLAILNPLSILSRGYSITTKQSRQTILKDVRHIKTGDYVNTRLHKGSFLSIVKEIDGEI